VVFDGLESHHADGVLRLMEHIVRQQRTHSFPVMFVVTAVRGVLEQAGGLARDALEYLRIGAMTERIVLQPLQDGDLSLILDRFQSFDFSTRDVILRRAQGNPLYAVELAAHALRQPGSQAMPGSIAELWRRRVTLIAMRSQSGESAIRVLELVAVLGSPVWLDLLHHAWTAPSMEKLRQQHRHEDILGTWELWIEHGVLLEEQGGRVVFRHALLRETLISDMRGDRRHAWMHQAAAWAQRQLDLAQTPQDWYRLAEHLMYGQQPAEAWPFAHGAALQLAQQGQLREAQAAWSLCEQILARQGIPEHDERRTQVEVGAAQLAWRMGDPEEFRRRACLLCDGGRRTGQLSQLGLGELLLAELSLHDSAPQAAEELYGRALSRFETCGDDRGQCEALLGMARLALRSGRAQVAQRQVAMATPVLARLGDRAALGRARLLGGQCLCARGLLEPAEVILHQARQDFEAVGERLGVARALGELGQLAQAREDYRQAEELFSHYLQQAEALGDIPSIAQARANLGQARLKLGKHDSAVRLLEQSWAVTADLNDRSSSTIIQCVLALALARQGNWKRARGVLHSALESLRQLQLFDLDVAESLERIVLLPGARKRLERDFLLILGQARSQWRNLGYEERSHHVARLASRV
jgi:tetratricopeptide (TPR) repeat protein